MADRSKPPSAHEPEGGDTFPREFGIEFVVAVGVLTLIVITAFFVILLQ